MIWFISISQLVCLVIISVQNILILKYFQHSKQISNKLNSDMSLKKSLVITLTIGTASVAACWLPTSVIYIATMILHRYPINLVYLTIVVVIPLTSLISPIAFIIMNIRKLMDVKILSCEINTVASVVKNEKDSRNLNC